MMLIFLDRARWHLNLGGIFAHSFVAFNGSTMQTRAFKVAVPFILVVTF